ncbi:MAG TPA: Mn transporter [Deltaproteobacteria bacterium]|nr:Mn transporter [Deltaproteobacteria bacterium]
MLKKLLVLLSLIGPAIITSNLDNDAGGIAIYSIAGARYGYNLLWTLIPIIFLLIIAQEMSGRLGIVTGKGLADLIRENYGIRITFWVMLSFFFTNLGNTMAEFSGWAASMELFQVSKYISVPIGAVFVWFLVLKWQYSIFEKIFLSICVVYLTYVVSALLAKPDWAEVARKTVTPSVEFSAPYLIMIVSLIGTSITPWQQFYLQSGVVEKGLTKRDWWAVKFDVIVGSIMMGLVAYFIIVACGATLHPAGIQVESAEDAALSLKPLAGKYASTLFALGLANASLFSGCILPLVTTYYICEAMGWESGTGKSFREAPEFVVLYTIMIILGASIVLIPDLPLIKVMWFSQIINSLLLPVVLIFMLQLINRADLMGKYKNNRFTNIAAYLGTFVLIALNLILIVQTIHEMLVNP